MKIIFLDAVQNFGGSQKSTLHLIKNLQENHTVLYVDFWGTDTVLFDNLSQSGIAYKVIQQRATPIVIKAKKNPFLVIKNTFAYALNLHVLRGGFNQIASNFEADFVVVNNKKSLSIIGNKREFKVIFFERTWFAPSQVTVLARRLFSKVNYFFAVSNATKHALYAKGIARLDQIYLLPNAITLEKPYLPLTEPITKLRILNCGGYLRSKGLHNTLIIAKKLKALGIDFEVDIVGVLYEGSLSANYLRELNVFIEENSLQGNVFLHQDIKEMAPFYSKANLLIHPTSSEGLPRVVMEAMANSIPVIANAVGGVTDYILDGLTGFLAGFNDIDTYMQKILLLRTDIESYNFITHNAYKLIERSYNDEVQKENIKHILNQL